MTNGADSDTIPTNLRLLLVLEEVARAGVPVTPTDVNAQLGLPKPTIHRLFATLEDEGFLQRDIDGRAYSPGRRFRHMATGVLSSLRILGRTGAESLRFLVHNPVTNQCFGMFELLFHEFNILRLYISNNN